jgi:predicted dehydrogenase
MRDGLRINGEEHSHLYVKRLDFEPGGVDFYAGVTRDPADLEAENFFAAIENGTDPLVLPEQALVVTRVLEAIYASAKSGKPVYFE